MEYLTLKQAAEILQVQPRTIKQYIDNGKLRAANIGGQGPGHRYRIPRQEVDNFIQSLIDKSS